MRTSRRRLACSGIELATQGIENIGVMDINLVGLLHLRYRLVIGIKQMQQLGPVHA